MPFPVLKLTPKGLTETIQKMSAFPDELNRGMKAATEATLLTLWENVPPYPQVPNPVRSGLLGRTLGVGEGGGPMGEPSIYEVKEIGGGNYMGRFGTNLSYASYVIGAWQAWMHYRWWQMKDIAVKAMGKIEKLWQTLGDRMAKFLEEKGG